MMPLLHLFRQVQSNGRSMRVRTGRATTCRHFAVGLGRGFQLFCSWASSLHFLGQAWRMCLRFLVPPKLEPFSGVPPDQEPNPEWSIEKFYRNVLGMFFAGGRYVRLDISPSSGR